MLSGDEERGMMGTLGLLLFTDCWLSSNKIGKWKMDRQLCGFLSFCLMRKEIIE